jgi:hypothetical protein
MNIKYFSFRKGKLRDNTAIIPVIYYSLLAILIFYPFFSSGYILTLDMIWTPEKHTITEYIFNHGIGGQLPFIAIFQLAESVFPAEAVQKIILFLTLLIPGLAMHNSAPAESTQGKYFAGTLYMVNPFVYVRFLAGHYYILMAYAIVPLAIKAYTSFLKDSSTWKKTLFWITLISIWDLHVLLMVATILICILLFFIIENKSKVRALVKPHIKLFLIYIFLNMFWILPLFFPVTFESTLMDQISHQDLSAFMSAGTISGNVLISIAMMYGFWRGGYDYPFHTYPSWIFILLFAVILFLSVYGFFSRNSTCEGYLRKGMVIAGLISLILGTGVAYPYFAPLYRFLFDNIFILKGMREPQKFVGILVLMYSFLGSMGIDAIISEIKESSSLGRDRLAGKWKIVSAILMLTLILIPSAYSYTMFNGFNNQLKPTDYPEEWHDVKNYLSDDTTDFDILFFPWHQYMTFGWTERRIANPATAFFGRGTIAGENMEVGGIYTHNNNPTQNYIQYILDNRHNINNLGELIIPLNVKYIILAKEVDFKEYDFLYEQNDMNLVIENEKIALFQNNFTVTRTREVEQLEPIYGWEDIVLLSEEQNIEKCGFVRSEQGYNRKLSGHKVHKNLNYTTFSPFIYQVDAHSDYVAFTSPNHEPEGWIAVDSRKIKSIGLRIIFGPNTISKDILLYWPIVVHATGIVISILSLILLYLETTLRTNLTRIGKK